MLKLQLQYFGYLVQKADSLDKTLMLGKIEGRRRSGQIDGEIVKTVADFILRGSKIIAAMKFKDTYSLGEKLWPT